MNQTQQRINFGTSARIDFNEYLIYNFLLQACVKGISFENLIKLQRIVKALENDRQKKD